VYKYKKILNKYLLEYLKKPYSKQLSSHLLRFEEMYKPNEGSLYAYKFMPGYREDLQFLKSQIYLTNKSLIKSFKTDIGKTLMLTSSGKKVLFKEYPLQKLRSEKWDEMWSLISYDISSNKIRNFLRRLLIENGFGTLHQSLMVSPLNVAEGISEFIKSKNLESKVSVFRCKRILGLSNVEIANKVFNLQEINLLYTDLYTNYNNAKQTKTGMGKWKNYFLAVNYFDPYLPYELLANSWKGDDCITLFRKESSFIYKIMRKITKN